jgi:transcriptional regulator with XRE-family HTH domain
MRHNCCILSLSFEIFKSIYMNLEGIGKRLREERERLKLSQDELAAVAGTNRMTPSRYEQGSQVPTLPFLEVIGNAGVDVDYVLMGKRVEVVLSKADAAQLGLAISMVSDVLLQHQLEVSEEVKGRLVIKALQLAEAASRGSKMKPLSLKQLLSEITS